MERTGNKGALAVGFRIGRSRHTRQFGRTAFILKCPIHLVCLLFFFGQVDVNVHVAFFVHHHSYHFEPRVVEIKTDFVIAVGPDDVLGAHNGFFYAIDGYGLRRGFG